MNKFEKPTPQTIENPYIVIPESNEENILSISKGKFCVFVPIFMLCFFMVGPIVSLCVNGLPFLIPILLIPVILILSCCKSKIQLIKDKSKNRLTIVEKYYFCCKKRHNLSLEYTDFKVLGYGSESGPFCNHELSTIIAININPNVADLDNSNIKNIPFKFLYKFYNLIGERRQLELNLINFIGSKFENKIKDEIDLYVPKKNDNKIVFSFNRINQNNDIFVKISDHFYMFYNYYFLMIAKSNESFERLDWIYSNDFDRIFIGVVKNDSSYVNTFIYNTNTIDKFILEIKEGKFCFKILLKDGTNAEICSYKREQERNLNTFIYLINGQINKINNVNQNQVIQDNSAPTIE